MVWYTVSIFRPKQYWEAAKRSSPPLQELRMKAGQRENCTKNINSTADRQPKVQIKLETGFVKLWSFLYVQMLNH